MDRDFQDTSEQQDEIVGFPSMRMIVLLYSLGALIGLFFAFNPAMSSLQTTNCLLLSWLLATAALGMSILVDSSPTEIDEDFESF